MKILVTGAAGFIGFHVSLKLIERGDDVVGFDNVNNYYDPSLKQKRLSLLEEASNNSPGSFIFNKEDLADNKKVEICFQKNKFEKVINLAAQAGVRKSLQDPLSYVDSNIVGFVNILEGCRNHSIKHLIYASTSSVYGLNKKLPFSENDISDHPIQIYAATKRANELMAHSYSHLFKIPTTGLRFFTVYGPWGRPDMALFKFTANIISGKPIQIYNHGKHSRDFTYIDDIVRGIILALDNVAVPSDNWNALNPNPSSSSAPFNIYNIGSGSKVSLEEYISAIEEELGIKAKKEYLEMQLGDVEESSADISKISSQTGYESTVEYKEGVSRFIKWYKSYYLNS